jgi:hypothetical protein
MLPPYRGCYARRRASVAIGFAITYVALAPTSASAQQRTTVAGTVRGSDGRPLEGATVVLDPDDNATRTGSDAGGRFRLPNVLNGRHVLRTVRVGYQFNERQLDLQGGTVDIEIVLERFTQLDTVPVLATRTGVFGKILNPDISPIAGASIDVLGARVRAASAADGSFNFPAVKEGAYIVSIDRKGYASRLLSIFVPHDGGVELAAVLVPSDEGTQSKRYASVLTEFESRVRLRNMRAALVPRHAFAGRYGMMLGDALRYTSAFLNTHLVLDDEACLFVDGQPKPTLTAWNYSAADVEAVEVYGDRGDQSSTLLSRWPPGMPCGAGSNTVPRSSSKFGLQPGGVRSGRTSRSNRVAAIVIWLKR